MIKSLINNIMKYEKNPELTPIKIDAKGRISCTSGILYALIYPNFHSFPDKTLYLDYRLFCNTILPLLADNPKIDIYGDKFNLKTDEVNLNIMTLEPFEDYVESLNHLAKILEHVKSEYRNIEFDLSEAQLPILQNMMVNLTLSKSLNQYMDLFFIRYIDNKLVSISPISLMIMKVMKKIPQPVDFPGVYIQSILGLKGVNSEIYDADEYIYTRLISDGGEAHVLCKKVHYELPNYQKYLRTMKIIGKGIYDLDVTNELFKLIAPFENTYWMNDLELKCDNKEGIIKFKSFRGEIIKKMPKSKGIYDISINSKLFRIISKLGLIQITKYPDCIKFSKSGSEIVFLISNYQEGN